MFEYILFAIVFGLFGLFMFFRLNRLPNIPFLPRKFPYIYGNIVKTKHRALQFAEFYQNHREEPIIGIHVFLKSSVLIIDLNITRAILIEGFQSFQNRGMYSNEIDDPLSAILGTLEHDKWKSLRSKLTPAFTPAKIKGMFSTLKKIGDEFVRGLNEVVITDNMVEICGLFSEFTTDAIGSSAIGIEKNPELRKMTKKAMKPYLTFPYNILIFAHPKIAKLLHIRKHPADVSNFFVGVVEQTIQMRLKDTIKRNDFMQVLIDAKLTINEIAALAFDLLSAGYADSTSTLAYCLYELALPKNKHVQDKARDTIRSVLEQHNGELTFDAYIEMVYCTNIIKETLRKHPVAGSATRVATKAFKVPNTDFIIPKGMRVLIPIFGIHHDESFYPNPEEFIPEREFPPGAYLPFGDGPRKCIGFRFAELLIGIGLVSLLQHFEFSTCEKTQIPIEYSTAKNTLIPSNGVWLNVHQI